MSRQEAPQECGLRRHCQKPPSLRILQASKPTGIVRWPLGADPASNGTVVRTAFISPYKPKSVRNFHECEKKCALKVVISKTIVRFVERSPKHCYSNVKARREESRGGVLRAANSNGAIAGGNRTITHRLCGGSKQRSAPPLAAFFPPFLAGQERAPEGKPARRIALQSLNGNPSKFENNPPVEAAN